MDTFVGSALNDTFTAAATSASTGLAATTVQSGDTIDGGTGTDTLTITATSANNATLTGLVVSNVENIVVVGSDNLGTGTVAAVAAVAGAKEKIKITATIAATAASNETFTLQINGVTYGNSDGTNSTATDKADDIATLVTAALGDLVTVSRDSTPDGDLYVESNVVGKALPTLTFTTSATTNASTVATVATRVLANVAFPQFCRHSS